MWIALHLSRRERASGRAQDPRVMLKRLSRNPRNSAGRGRVHEERRAGAHVSAASHERRVAPGATVALEDAPPALHIWLVALAIHHSPTTQFSPHRRLAECWCALHM